MKRYIKSSDITNNELLSQLQELAADWAQDPEGTAVAMCELVGGSCSVERKDAGKQFRAYDSDYKLANSYKVHNRENKSDRVFIHYSVPGSARTVSGDRRIVLTKNNTGWSWLCFAEELFDAYCKANGGCNYSPTLPVSDPSDFNVIHP